MKVSDKIYVDEAAESPSMRVARTDDGEAVFTINNKQVFLNDSQVPRLIAQLTAALPAELHVSHSQTLTAGADGVTAVPLAPVVYTLDQFQEAIESLRKDPERANELSSNTCQLPAEDTMEVRTHQ